MSLELPLGFTRNSFTGAIVTPSGAGKSFDLRSAKRFYKALQRGIQTSLANANLMDKFVMSDRHTSGSTAVFKRYYLIAYFGINAHFEFTDPDDNRKSYCKGIVINIITQWIGSSKPNNFIIIINWDSVW